MDLSESIPTWSSSVKDESLVRKKSLLASDDAVRIKVFLCVVDESLASAVAAQLTSAPFLDLVVPSYLLVSELLERCLSQFNEVLRPNFRLAHNARLYDVCLAGKKTGLPKEDYPPLELDNRIAMTKMNTFSVVCKEPAIQGVQATTLGGAQQCCCAIF